MDVNRRCPDSLDGKIVEPLNCCGTPIHVHVVFERADLRGSRRQDQILRADRIHHVEWR